MASSQKGRPNASASRRTRRSKPTARLTLHSPPDTAAAGMQPKPWALIAGTGLLRQLEQACNGSTTAAHQRWRPSGRRSQPADPHSAVAEVTHPNLHRFFSLSVLEDHL